MYYDITEIEYVGDYKLKLTFENGKGGIVDFANYIKPGSVYARFSNIEYFKQAYIHPELGVLCWPGDVDVAPETVYHEATGEPLPTWMEIDKKTLTG
mgnify:CR=1 FL=1